HIPAIIIVAVIVAIAVAIAVATVAAIVAPAFVATVAAIIIVAIITAVIVAVVVVVAVVRIAAVIVVLVGLVFTAFVFLARFAARGFRDDAEIMVRMLQHVFSQNGVFRLGIARQGDIFLVHLMGVAPHPNARTIAVIAAGQAIAGAPIGPPTVTALAARPF